MTHPLVIQLRFARSEFARALVGLDDAGARRRFPPMNAITWTIGHLAEFEQSVWLTLLQGKTPLPDLEQRFGYGQPASAPPLAETRAAWDTIILAADPYLDTLTEATLLRVTSDDHDADAPQTAGSLTLRMIYHYWYHCGEVMAVRQLLGHADLPEFVGQQEALAPYQPW
jgi:uncharacterized damage-inducible protein DinB